MTGLFGDKQAKIDGYFTKPEELKFLDAVQVLPKNQVILSRIIFGARIIEPGLAEVTVFGTESLRKTTRQDFL